MINYILIEKKSNSFQFKNIHSIEKKLTRFQIYPEIELACKNSKTLFRNHYSEIFIQYEKDLDLKTGKLIIDIADTNQNRDDDKSYIPLIIYKANGKIEGHFSQKTSIEFDYKN